MLTRKHEASCMRCVVGLARISARKWSIILGFAVLRGRVYEEPLKQWEWLLGVVLQIWVFQYFLSIT